MHTMCNSTTFALRHTQISLSSILRHFRPPSRHLLLNTHDTNMEFLQLNGPMLDIFLFFSKTKIFHSHPWERNDNPVTSQENSVNCTQLTSDREVVLRCQLHVFFVGRPSINRVRQNIAELTVVLSFLFDFSQLLVGCWPWESDAVDMVLDFLLKSWVLSLFWWTSWQCVWCHHCLACAVDH